MTSTTLLRAAGSNVVFDTTALGMPGNTATSTSPECPVVDRSIRQPAWRRVRSRLRLGSRLPSDDGTARLYQWLSTQGAQGAGD